MILIFDEFSNRIRGKEIRIVYPEATDVRILGAVSRLIKSDLVKPVLIGNSDVVKNVASENSFDIDGAEIIDPENYAEFDAMVDAFVKRRGGKATEEQARQLLKDNAYFGTMLVQMDKADGLVCGANYTTGDTVRPALQIIKTKPGVSVVSGSYVMIDPRGERNLMFADCAININPNAKQLAEIAVSTAKTAQLFNIEPKVAMLSFSTKGSGAGEMVDKVVKATELAKEIAPDIAIDGELQFDAAYDPTTSAKKAPESDVAGQASVFVFPEIQSGNIGYKIAQRLGNYEAIGPILQGMNKPISDLSRGCNEEDVFKISIITAAQVFENE